MRYHCSFLEARGWKRAGCPERAAVVYLRPDGARVAACSLHRQEADRQARLHGWVVDWPVLEMVA